MPENQNIEWKSSWRDEYLKWICGFANAKGGKLYIGVDDQGKVLGLSDSKQLMENLPNKITNHLGIVCDILLHNEDEKEYIEIAVHQYNMPISYHGKYYIRIGSTNQELKDARLNEFLLKKTGKTWDDVIEPKASLEDIDENALLAFKKYAIKSKRLTHLGEEDDPMQILKNLRLIEEGQLKRAAILLFGKDPGKYFISAYIKIGRFGNSDHDLLSQEVIEGNMLQITNTTIEILDKKYLKKHISYEGLQRIETPEYPYEALREAILNAVTHQQYLLGTPIQIRVYDDKLMIWNYGTLPEQLTFEQLKQTHTSYPRNPTIAGVFFKAGLVESWGRGT